MRRLRFSQWIVGLVLGVTLASPAGAVEIGAKIGVTVADQQTDANIASDNRWGLCMSIFGRWSIQQNVNLTGEIGYTQRGARNAHVVSGRTPNPEMSSVDHRLDYITMPIVADLGVQVANITVFGGAGPRFDILMNDAFSRESDTLNAFYADFDRVVFGATLVGGIRSLESRISFEFQYNWDVTDSYSASDNIYFRSRAFDIVFGFAF